MVDKKPGRRRRWFENPRPVENWVTDHDDGREVLLGTIDEVGPLELDLAENLLRAYFSKRRDQLVSQEGETLSTAQLRIIRLAQSALSDTGSVWWSGYSVEKVVDIPPEGLRALGPRR